MDLLKSLEPHHNSSEDDESSSKEFSNEESSSKVENSSHEELSNPDNDNDATLIARIENLKIESMTSRD
jgi:hypothetical protein